MSPLTRPNQVTTSKINDKLFIKWFIKALSLYSRTKPVAKVDFKSRQMDEQTSPVAKSGGLKKFGGTKSVMQPTKVEEDDLEEEGGNLMSKLESFSGMWNDMDEAPVLIETTKTKKRLEQASAPKSPVKLETETKPVPKVKEVDPEEAKKKELDNQKRIESLKQRNEALKAQHNLIKSALSLGQQNNRKIKFEDVDPEPEADRGRPKKSKKKQLFDEEELMEELGDEETWKLRPHLDGQTGQEVNFNNCIHPERRKLTWHNFFPASYWSCNRVTETMPASN